MMSLYCWIAVKKNKKWDADNHASLALEVQVLLEAKSSSMSFDT